MSLESHLKPLFCKVRDQLVFPVLCFHFPEFPRLKIFNILDN